ncbi:GIY-YIG nuclease family protein [Elizabethkingia anophelis]|uniref:GIY-YIG nuclease family protein n=1 Tax=Elizabethkingia anophelis TaxID=1117645 RepID=UPI00293C8DA6|nr:hypothetical protein [Elizabethkingia anophelis]
MKESVHYVYLLRCPLNNEVKYVGVSMNPKVRFRGHLNDYGNKAKMQWIKSLKESNLLPVMEVVDSCDKRIDVSDLESKYIEKYRGTIFNSKSKNNFPSKYHSNYLLRDK